VYAEPQVRPAPIPVMSTRVPFASLPAATASARQRGIDADDVFPYFWTLTKIFSFGMPSFPAAWSMIRLFAWCGM